MGMREIQTPCPCRYTPRTFDTAPCRCYNHPAAGWEETPLEYKDYYQILGVSRSATDKEIKRAYRRLARECHPDRHPGDAKAEERFKEINEAHEVLGDAEKRSRYDRLGAQWQQWQHMGGDPQGFDFSQWFGTGAGRGPGRGPRTYPYGGFGGQEGFSDFFESIFGTSGGNGPGVWSGARPGAQARAQRGQDYEQPVDLTLEEAFHGTRRVLQVQGNRLEVRIPPGVRTGSRVRVSGQGGLGMQGGPAGDIYLRVNVLDHSTFERQGDDLTCELPIDLYTAMLGGEVRVDTLSGPVVLNIPPETQSGRIFRLRGRGMPLLHDSNRHGDLRARVRITVPLGLSAEEKELFHQLARLRPRGGSAPS